MRLTACALRNLFACGGLVAAVLLAHGCSDSEGSSPGGSGGDAGPGDASASGGSGGVTADAAGGSAGGSGTAGGSSASAGAGGEAGAPPDCDDDTPPEPTGETIEVTPPTTIAEALGSASAGDRLLLHAGAYGSETISDASFASFVFIEAAEGESVSVPGLSFQSCDHVVLRGFSVEGTLELDGSSDFRLSNLTLDAGSSEEASLHFRGTSHDIVIEQSTIQGGGRTIFVQVNFAPDETWNHHLEFVENEITCGSHNCFQISGGRDLLIEGNEIIGNGTSGVLTAGATRVKIARNRFRGMNAAAVQLATPGAEWDDYAGVEYMISSVISVENNVIDGWNNAVQLDAVTDIAIVYNTVADGTGIRFNHRTPHDQQSNVILDGNSEIRVWNNVLPSLSLDSAEARPSFESNNLVFESGGGGMNLITDMPAFDGATDYELSSTSPALGAAIVNDETPLVDFRAQPRGADPDVGAYERGAAPPACP